MSSKAASQPAGQSRAGWRAGARLAAVAAALTVAWAARGRAMHAAQEVSPGQPTLPLVSNVPWDPVYDSFSTTDALLRALLFAMIVLALLEVAKSLARRRDEAGTYVLLLALQVVCALDCFYQAAPDWASHAVSWFFGAVVLNYHAPTAYAPPLGSTLLAGVLTVKEAMKLSHSRREI